MKPTKYALISTIIRARILRGVYKDRLPGERELARELQSDVKTIRGALIQLDALGLVELQSRRGTFVTPRGPDGLPVTQLTVQFLLPTGDPAAVDMWSMRMLLVFEKAAAEYGAKIAMASVDARHPTAVVETVLARSRSLSSLGVVLIGMPLDSATALKLAEANRPVVVADWHIDDPVIPCVVFDDRRAGQLVAEHLLKLGHRRIAYINYLPMDSPQVERWEGFATELRAAGVPVPPMRPAPLAAIWPTLGGPDAPTAIVLPGGSSSELPPEARSHLSATVPGRVSLIGFGGVIAANDHDITYIAMDEPTMARETINALLDEEIRAHPRRIHVPVSLVDRGTTAPPPK
jgi:DNA-binding LacI/PurR family transcriptional regulator